MSTALESDATPMEAAAKLLFGDDEAPRMIRALTTARDLEERRRSPADARGATRRSVDRARLLAPPDRQLCRAQSPVAVDELDAMLAPDRLPDL